MSSIIVKEEDNPCNKDDEKHIKCTKDIKKLQITCTDALTLKYVLIVEKRVVI